MQWSCEYCIEKKLDKGRNCKGDMLSPFRKRVFDVIFTRCPVSEIDLECAEVLNVVDLCEGGGLGGGRSSPSELLRETAFYWNVRAISMSEKHRVSALRKKEEKK